LPPRRVILEDNSLWYKDAVIYELHVKSFCDSNDDGIGDFRGLIHKLDYLQGLGITALWLLPFYPSPLKDDGYDIADYYNINPDYGTLNDFRDFLREAHGRGIRVITELVVNHTSNQHPWFQRARRAAAGTPFRDYYVWSETPDRFREARIIFKDFETSNWTWDPVAQAYFWHRFYSHQPDLNYENSHLQREILRVVDFWLGMGVDGLRLDAVPYLYEEENTNCENLPQTHAFLKKLRAHVDSKFKNRTLLSEANQWPEDAAAYFGDSDECHMAFHFPVMPRLFMGIRMEDRFPILDILEQTPQIPPDCQWAMFLRNHDELTLEMVTDEERDYMYRVYAADSRARINLGIRRRLAPLLDNNRRKIELMNILLFSLPGTPIIYYGDELGMGDNYYLGDRDGVRTPMQWSPDRNAGFSRANPHSLFLPVIIDPEYHYEVLNVENQERNLSSLLWWLKRVLMMRKSFMAFGRGTVEFIDSDNPKVIAFIRRYKDEVLLVVANLSRFSQAVRLQLAPYADYVPEEVFSRNTFPQIDKTPYVLTLAFHDYFWFVLREPRALQLRKEKTPLPAISVRTSWESLLKPEERGKLEAALPVFLKQSRWFGAKNKTLQRVRIIEAISCPVNGRQAFFLILEVSYTEGLAEKYLLPVACTTDGDQSPGTVAASQAVIARIQSPAGESLLFDAAYDEDFQKRLLEMIAWPRNRAHRGQHYELATESVKGLRRSLQREFPVDIEVNKTEQSNTSIRYGDKYFLKLYRRLDPGINPEVEICRFLTEVVGFPHIPPFLGVLELRRDVGQERTALAVLQGFTANQGDAWTYSLEAATRFYEHVLERRAEIFADPGLARFEPGFRIPAVPSKTRELVGAEYLDRAALLGRRTGELHLALAAPAGFQGFEPEPFSKLYQRALYQSITGLVRQVMRSLKSGRERLPEAVRDDVDNVLGWEDLIRNRVKMIMGKKLTLTKIRIHGDYHLGQVLWTGKDFVIIDFEGEPARSLSERRLKRSALRDIAGMIRSFHYAAHGAFLLRSPFRPEDVEILRPWAEVWSWYAGGMFLQSYLETVGEAPFIPAERADFDLLLEILLLEKCVYELGYELDNRPDWVGIPLAGLKDLIKRTPH
jgi:maltose alpha-D-glucosyltransferase/alpha-amylase